MLCKEKRSWIRLNHWNAAQNHKLLKMCPRNNPNEMLSVQ
jgi:hypothetical protein